MSKITEYKDSQSQYAKDDRGDATGAFAAFVRDPRPMDQEPRNMYAGGQLVQSNIDGSRPGYSGDNIEPNIAKSPAGNFQVTYKEKYLGTFKSIEEAREIRDTAKKDSPRIKGQGKKLQPGSQSAKIRTILDSYIAEGKNTYTFKEIIKSADITSKKEESKFRKNLEGLLNRKDGIEKYNNLKMISSNLLNGEDRLKVISNFDLPEGQTNWDFDKYKYGTDPRKNELLSKRIIAGLTTNKDIPLAASFGNAKGWMMNSMYRVFQNQTKNNIALTYEPIYGEVATGKTKIIGFKDNTPSGKGGNFYGLDKYTKEDATDWNDHEDYKKVQKMVNITDGVRQAPSDVLQKLLTKKGITANLRLNDILSYDRYYTKLSEVSPKELIRTQIVKHHSGGVGAKGNLNAAATKDIQLLTGANNATVVNYENIVNGTGKKVARALTADENKILKNMGAKITGLDGKVYGGGSLDANKQFALIEKQAAEMIKGENFTPKKIAGYLEKLGCGKAAGGRIFMNNGGSTLTKCAMKGQRKLDQLILKGGGSKAENSLAEVILKAGKGLKSIASLKGLLGPGALALEAAIEAGLTGYDMLSKGKTFREAVGDSLFNYALGDKTKIDPRKERDKRFRTEGMSEEDMGKIAAFESANKEIDQISNLYDKLDTAEQGQLDEMSEDSDFSYLPNRTKEFKKQEDEARADIQDVGRTGSIDRLTNVDYQGGATALAEANRRAELAQLKSVDFNLQSRKGNEKRFARINELNFQDPKYKEYMGPFPTNYGFAGGGIASLKKKYYD